MDEERRSTYTFPVSPAFLRSDRSSVRTHLIYSFSGSTTARIDCKATPSVIGNTTFVLASLDTIKSRVAPNLANPRSLLLT